MSGWIDTHCHLDAAEFDADRDAVRASARAAGVSRLVIPAVERANWGAVRDLARRHGDAYALGIHPLYAPRAAQQDIALLEAALEQERSDARLVALGEIGLDFFVPAVHAQRQEELLRAQLRLARRFDLPVLLHVRRAVDRVLKHLRQTSVPGGIAHAFNGSAQQAQAFIALGFKLGFGGALTHQRALRLRRLARELPATAIVMETDAPDMPPHWIYRSAHQRAAGAPQGRNSPAELARIGAQLAQLRAVDVGEWADITYRNALEALPGLRG